MTIPRPTTEWLNVLYFVLWRFVGAILPRAICCSTPLGLLGCVLFFGASGFTAGYGCLTPPGL